MNLTEPDLVAITQEYIAVDMTGGTALRNQEPGVVAGIRTGLCKITLAGVAETIDTGMYERWLDDQTDALLHSVDVKVRVSTRPWGTARKALNLFMRGCVCDHLLRAAHHLDRVEAAAELPLDGVVAIRLKQLAGRGRLPEWPGLKHLTRDDHRLFQIFAAQEAERRGMRARIYLDYLLWLRARPSR
ncbi:MAG: hypothetical protein IT430_00090 [Phycisphaerales bacterium]|nr:hypothetical protein [Phycisphaerales bacterium]